MHILVASRGPRKYSRNFWESLSHQPLPYPNKIKGKKGMQMGSLQCRVCPIQLYDVSFPRDCRDAILTTLFSVDCEEGGKPMMQGMRKWVRWLGKFLKLKPIPKKWSTKKRINCERPDNMEMVGIGIKEDRDDEHGQEQI